MLPLAELIADAGSEFKPSALCDHVRVLDCSQIRKRLGRVSDNALTSIGLGLAFIFDLR
jgi:mRNA-degrading endonuclease toxin of MazEF toxin-antitoxin module